MRTNIKRFRLGVSHNTFNTIAPTLADDFLNHLATSFAPEEELVSGISSTFSSSGESLLDSSFTMDALKGVFLTPGTLLLETMGFLIPFFGTLETMV